MNYMPTYYEILGLPEILHNGAAISAQTLRGAYRRALLLNHPDKSAKGLSPKETIFSIDQITQAFSTLSNPTSRSNYDKELSRDITAPNDGFQRGGQAFRTGIETMDLDDLKVNEAQDVWYRSCRCGDQRGFLIGEADLEGAADEGELSVGCRGCSLWIKVLFGVVEDGMNIVNATSENKRS